MCQKCSGVPAGDWFQVSVPWLKKVGKHCSKLCVCACTHRSWDERTQENSERTKNFPWKKFFAHILCTSSHIQKISGNIAPSPATTEKKAKRCKECCFFWWTFL